MLHKKTHDKPENLSWVTHVAPVKAHGHASERAQTQIDGFDHLGEAPAFGREYGLDLTR
jgi:hypothetical protein